MYENIRVPPPPPPPPWDGDAHSMNIFVWTTYKESKQRFRSIKQGGSDSEVIICLSTKFEVSVYLTVIESYNGFGIYPFRHCHKRLVE